MTTVLNSENEMITFGKAIGNLLQGGEVIELVGDVGSGKTTLVKGIASGLGIAEYVQSPSFTINRSYVGRDNITLSHYDFYRLDDAGILANELQEVIGDPNTVTVIEWAGVVENVLPGDRLSVYISATTETSRELIINSGGNASQNLKDKLKI